MSHRRRNAVTAPWVRPFMGSLALLGAGETAYLTVTKLLGTSAICPVEGCETVLSSPYATVFGLPLSLFGCWAYLAIALMAFAPLVVPHPNQTQNVGAESAETVTEASIDWRYRLETWTQLPLFLFSLAMAVFSGYLMYLLLTEFKAICPYCILSAGLSFALLCISVFGQYWEDLGDLIFNGAIAGTIVLVGTLGLYSGLGNAASAPTTGKGPAITTLSTESDVALAQYLRQSGAKMYGAYWCSHCYEQKELFGQLASQSLPYVECAVPGQPTQSKVCQAAGIKSYPTWVIGKETYLGVQSLEDLANFVDYQGSRKF